MEYRDPIDPAPDEKCTPLMQLELAKFAQTEYLPPPGFMLDSEPKQKNRWRLRPELRAVAQRKDPAHALASAVHVLFWASAPDKAPDAVRPLLKEQPPRVMEFAVALADLAVSGRESFGKFCGITDADIVNRVNAEIIARDPTTSLAPVPNLVRIVLDRAYAVADALRTQRNRQLYFAGVDKFGWIAVSGEDDAPHRPVNVPTAPYPNFDLKVGPANRPLVARFIVVSDSTRIRSPLVGPIEGLRSCPDEPLPKVPPNEEIILFLHGHSSRAEECLDLAPYLWQPAGSKSCKRYCVIALDLPSCGYSSMVDWEPLVQQEDSDELLRFVQQFVVDFIDRLAETTSIMLPSGARLNLKERIAAVIGGSLGGNLCLRLGQQTEPFWLNNIVPWSPASIWDPYEGDFPPFKSIAVLVPKGRATDKEIPADSRDGYFSQVFEKPASGADRWVQDAVKALTVALGPFAPVASVILAIISELVDSGTQPDQWYREDWQSCKGSYISFAMQDRLEIYNENFRKWHWRLAFEQLRFSHRAPSGDPRYLHVHSRTLLCAGEKDDYKWTGIYSATRDTASKMLATSGTTFFPKRTGHSIHNERPALLAAAIHDFLPPLPDSWGAWDKSLGGSLITRPCVVFNQDQRMEVFALGQNRRVWHIGQNVLGSWAGSGWAELSPGLPGDVSFSGPVSCNIGARTQAQGRNRQGEIEIFATDTTGRVCHIWQNGRNNGWRDWDRNLSGNPQDGIEHGAGSSVAVTFKTKNGLQVIAWRDAAGNMRLRGQTTILDGWWDSWADKLPLQAFAAPPVIATNGNGVVEVFATAGNGEVFSVQETGVDQDNYGKAWVSLGGSIVPGTLMAFFNDGNGLRGEQTADRLMLFGRGSSGDLQFAWQSQPNMQSWTSWGSLGGELLEGTVPAVMRSDRYGGLIIFVRWKDRTIAYRRQTPEREDRKWSDWTPLGTGTFRSDPVVVNKVRGPDAGLELFAVGEDEALWVIRQLDCPEPMLR